jgi:murein DD-endopeptidase MepM/ murein hydrolase activator NlpD
MKQLLAKVILPLTGLLLAPASAAQSTLAEVLEASRAGHDFRAKQLDDQGRIIEVGGGVFVPPMDHMSPLERLQIMNAIEENRARLKAEGRLAVTSAKAIANFAWPLRQAAGRADFNYHGIGAFIDQNPAFPNQLLDYNCGTRTYDLASGYNHQGTDIFNAPFAWKKMDDEDVVIAAGAPGTIVHKSDGNYDRNCAVGGGTWNAVYVQHADGSVAWYGHMKNGSTTVKGVGETVVAGEYLGSVGSSGSSTGPHLHLELHDASNALVDPWQGACNTKSQQVRWAQQRAYRDTGVNAMTVGSAAPSFPTCPAPEISNATDYVTPGSTAYFAVYLRDQTVATPLGIRLLRPDGSVYSSPSPTGTGDYNASYYYWYFSNFPATAGTWTFEATIAGKTYTKTFQVGGSAPYGSPASIAAMAGSSQSTPPGSAFPAPLRVLVTDAQGRAVKGARVSYTAPASGATAVFESRSAITDATGVAAVSALANATAGAYAVTASVPGAAANATITLQNNPLAVPSRLSNISTRGPALTGNDVMIGGFIVGGTLPKKVLITARGPSLTAYGVTGALANPKLELYAGQAKILENDDWQTNGAAVIAEIQATGIAPASAQESALMATLNPGAYTAVVSGVGGGTGVAIVEVFEQDRPDAPLVNISTRGQVQAADRVMIGGFIVQGDSHRQVLVTARGPSLAPYGIANPLANPRLEIFSGQTKLFENDDWQVQAGGASAVAAIQATGVAPTDPKEAALLVTLPPGAYTAIVSGVGGVTGVGIVEVFAR